jgi:hypothetical protein
MGDEVLPVLVGRLACLEVLEGVAPDQVGAGSRLEELPGPLDGAAGRGRGVLALEKQGPVVGVGPLDLGQGLPAPKKAMRRSPNMRRLLSVPALASVRLAM